MATPCWCDRLEVAKECYSCATQRDSPYAWGYLPRDCCLLLARPARKDEAKTYRLMGPVENWWLCPECKRAFGMDPSSIGKWVDGRPQQRRY